MRTPRYTATPGSRRWIVTLAALTAITALSIDMSLPAQPTLARVFDVSPETAALSLSVFLLAFAAAQLFVGYISDAIGRRRVMLSGLGLFVVAGIACAVSPNIYVLLVCRVLQGVGAAAVPVVARAMIRDTQHPGDAARYLSTMLATLAVAPMIAPTLGSSLMHAFGWRSIFLALAVLGAVLALLAYSSLSETLPVERRHPPSAMGLVRGFKQYFTTPGVKLPILISCATFAGQFAYIAASPFVLMEGYGVSSSSYSIYFAVTALALMFGSITGGKILKAGRSTGGMLVIGTTILCTGGVLVLIGTNASSSILAFVIPMLIFFFGAGLTSPSATALAMEPVPQLAGTASSAVGSLTMIAGSLSGYETTRFGGSSPTTFSLVAALMGAVAFVLATGAAVLRHRQKQHESRYPQVAHR